LDHISVSARWPDQTFYLSTGTEFLESDAEIPVKISLEAAPTNDLIVTQSGDASLNFPSTVTVSVGQTSANFVFSILDNALHLQSHHQCSRIHFCYPKLYDS